MSSARTREIADRFARVRGALDEAVRRSGRSPDDVTLVVVTKTFPVGDVEGAIAAGATDLGENRVQEAEEKRPAAAGADRVRWHLIGPLQSNKARRAVRLFDSVQTIDSIDLARRLDRLVAEEGRPPLEVLLEVNLAAEESKAGLRPEELSAAAPAVASLPNLRLAGLMAIPPPGERPADVRPWVARLRDLRDAAAAILPDGARLRFRHLSIGMSADFAEAAEEGATIVRVGSAIFGSRG